MSKSDLVYVFIGLKFFLAVAYAFLAIALLAGRKKLEIGTLTSLALLYFGICVCEFLIAQKGLSHATELVA